MARIRLSHLTCLFLFANLGISLGSTIPIPTPASSESEASESESYEASTTEAELLTTENPVVLLAEGSEKNIVKVENKKIVGNSDEKLGTSATVPIGYANTNGISYESPIYGGAYGQPHGPIAQYPAHPPQVAIHHAGGGQVVHHHQEQIGHPIPHTAPGVIPPSGGGYGSPITGPSGYGAPLTGPGPGQLVHTHHHNTQFVPATGGYGGVVYGGHGIPTGASKEQVSLNKESQVSVGPYGEIQRGDTIHKSINRVDSPHPHLVGMPYSPYGHGGVVYMGNGLIPEHVAGVQLAGPVLPPKGYQQQRQQVSINQHSSPFGTVQNVQKSINTNTVGPFHRGIHPNSIPYHHQPFGFNQFGHGPMNGAFGYNPYLSHPPPQHHQQIALNKNSESSIDPYGNHHQRIDKQKHITNSHGPAPIGLGYNGRDNRVIAHHTDQAILKNQHPSGPGIERFHTFHQNSPDPYYNNEVDPIYRTSYQPNLVTTGPNRDYRGKNPIGVYERYHRLG